ncbi:30S ribosomal protein S4 [Candidatus Bathyarchaeota archaeon]|nr:30S ribosomal protein S4 [Candidatus Bathyarchaeota archaeon]
MGDPRKQRKKYETPRHPWRREQLEAELKLLGEYGLRNKRELWRYKSMLSKIRAIARSLLGKPEEEREKLRREYIPKLVKLGLLPENAGIDEVLDLDVKNLLERRLQTLVFKLNLAKSIHQARQLVTHGHIMIGDKIVSVPGYLVTKEEEALIKYAPQSPFNNLNHPALKKN